MAVTKEKQNREKCCKGYSERFAKLAAGDFPLIFAVSLVSEVSSRKYQYSEWSMKTSTDLSISM